MVSRYVLGKKSYKIVLGKELMEAVTDEMIDSSEPEKEIQLSSVSITKTDDGVITIN